MPESSLLAQEAMILLIDHQTHLFVRWGEQEYLSMKRHAQSLAQLATIFELPLLLVAVRGGRHSNHAGPVLGQLMSSSPQAKLVRTTKMNVWKEERVREEVRACGRQTILVAGVCADFGIVPAAVGASADGYKVRAALDPSGAWNPLITQTVIARLNQAGAAATTWIALAAELQEDLANHSTGEALMKLLQETTPYWLSSQSHSKVARRHETTMATFGKLFG